MSVTTINDIGIVGLISRGSVGVFPTDTIYGLVASAANQPAVQRLYELKHRERKPGTVIAANTQQLIDLGVPRESIEAVAHLWPNPVSLDLLVGEKLEYFFCKPNDNLKQKEILRIERELGIRCRSL